MSDTKLNPIVQAYAEDAEKITKGVEVALQRLPGAVAVIRKMPNTDYLAAVDRKYADNQARLKELYDSGRDAEADAMNTQLMSEVLVETVIMRVSYRDGDKVVNVPKKQLIEMLSSQEMLPFRNELLSHAEDFELFRKYDVKN